MEGKVPSDCHRLLLLVCCHHLLDLGDGLARVQALRGAAEGGFILKLLFEEVAAVGGSLPWGRSWCSS